MAERKSAAVSSSQCTESLACAQPKLAQNTSRARNPRIFFIKSFLQMGNSSTRESFLGGRHRSTTSPELVAGTVVTVVTVADDHAGHKMQIRALFMKQLNF